RGTRNPRDHGAPHLRGGPGGRPGGAHQGGAPRPPRVLDQPLPVRDPGHGGRRSIASHPMRGGGDKGGPAMARGGNVSVARDIPARMRDGVTLFADVYVPEGAGPFPVLLMRTPYGKTQAQDSIHTHPLWYARRGSIVAVQDVRGRWCSGGDWS